MAEIVLLDQKNTRKVFVGDRITFTSVPRLRTRIWRWFRRVVLRWPWQPPTVVISDINEESGIITVSHG